MMKIEFVDIDLSEKMAKKYLFVWHFDQIKLSLHVLSINQLIYNVISRN